MRSEVLQVLPLQQGWVASPHCPMTMAGHAHIATPTMTLVQTRRAHNQPVTCIDSHIATAMHAPRVVIRAILPPIWPGIESTRVWMAETRNASLTNEGQHASGTRWRAAESDSCCGSRKVRTREL